MKQLDVYISDNSVQPQVCRLAEIYAQALIESLDGKVSPADAADELASLDKLIRSLPGGEQLMTCPTVSLNRRQKIVDEVGRFFSQPVANLLAVLAKNSRLELIGMIADACEKVVVRKAGEVEMVVRSAVKLDAATKNKIAGQLGDAIGAKCIIENVVDPRIIGGLILQKGDTIFDASIAGRLQRMAQAVADAKQVSNTQEVDR
ncbi:MAG TPA: ATP synthase F1 subunit delta [Phycisphaerae bacterium]|nr:ATP synthase F1 subunit delta [Phycisphaerae bacterium]HPS52613.1 ATP synthase F1 subunit delta [Phycisphaerae bacterium]